MKKILYLSLLFSSTLFSAFAQNRNENLNEGVYAIESPSFSSLSKTEDIASLFAGGSGTEADPYLIENKEQMKNFATLSSNPNSSGKWEKILEGVHFKQVADLDYSNNNEHISIGVNARFAGTFDGNGYVIKNYNHIYQGEIDRKDYYNNKNFGSSLFLNTDGATIKNVRMINTVIDLDISSDIISYSVAGLSSNSWYSKFINCKIEGTYSLKVKSAESTSKIGGLISNGRYNIIDHCQINETINCELNSLGGTSSKILCGGICAEASYSTIINCINKGDIKSNGYGYSEIFTVRNGGLIANSHDCKFINSCNKADTISVVIDNKQKDGLAFGQAAGLSPYMTNGEINNCWNKAEIFCQGSSIPAGSAIRPIAYTMENTTVENCYYQQFDSLKSQAGTTGLKKDFMMKSDFLTKLNSSLPEGALSWKTDIDEYPGLFNVYTVTLPKIEGATISPKDSIYKVEAEERFRFKLTLDKEYDLSTPVVKVNGETELTPNANGFYVTDPITEDIIISVTGIEKNPITANEEIEKRNVLSAHNGILYIHTEGPALIKVFNLLGQCIKSVTISDDTQIPLSKGLYLIQIDNKTYKINL